MTEPAVLARRWIERQFVTLTVQALLAAGHRLTLNRSGELTEGAVNGVLAILAATPDKIDEIMACDWETLYTVGPDATGWVQFVYGNGFYVISDYTTNLEEVLKPILLIAKNEDMEGLIAARDTAVTDLLTVCRTLLTEVRRVQPEDTLLMRMLRRAVAAVESGRTKPDEGLLPGPAPGAT